MGRTVNPILGWVFFDSPTEIAQGGPVVCRDCAAMSSGRCWRHAVTIEFVTTVPEIVPLLPWSAL